MEPEDIIQKIKTYLAESSLKGKYNHSASFKKYVILSFKDILKEDAELAEVLLDDSEQVIRGFKTILNVPILLDGIKELTHLRDIREDSTGKIVALEVGLRQKSGVIPRRESIRFACNKCGREEVIKQEHSKMERPTICKCANRKFRIREEYFEDFCKLNVEELPENTDALQPVKMRVFVRAPLTNIEYNNKYAPGDRVYIIGIVKQEQIYSSGKPTNSFKRYIETLYIKRLDEKADDTILKADQKHIAEIGELTIKEKLKYVSPAVVGYDKVKEAMLLQLVGGVKKEKDQTIKREMIHILLVGDPSTAKSVMGKSIIRLKPRARYVGGSKGVSSVGITAAVIKDEDGNFVLDCGSIVLANGSMLVIDEFEKMDPNAVEPLHEALAGGTITIDKAGVHATMQARTAVLAIANPKFGRWDPQKSVMDQVEMVPSLVSRFDFIFPLKDNLGIESDKAITSKILGSGKKEVETRDYQMFRKFIIHASALRPSLTDAAIKELEGFFVDTREKYRKIEQNKVPITFRQLEGLIRLTEAYAKLRLASRASKVDAEQAIAIMKYYLAQLGMDLDTMNAEIDNIELGETSGRKKSDFIMAQIPEGEIVEIEDVINACKLNGLDKREIEDIIEKLRKQGEIYEPQAGWFKRL